MYFHFLNLPVLWNHYYPLHPFIFMPSHVLNTNIYVGGWRLSEPISKSYPCCSAAFTDQSYDSERTKPSSETPQFSWVVLNTLYT